LVSGKRDASYLLSDATMDKAEKALVQKVKARFYSPIDGGIDFTRDENLILERWMVHKILNEKAFVDASAPQDEYKMYFQVPGYPFTHFGEQEINKSESIPTLAPKEDDFLRIEFNDIPLNEIGLDQIITETINFRLDEIKKCLAAEAPLSVIFLAGSALEGILLGIALNHPEQFNQSKSSPKDNEEKTKKFQDWTLNNFIDVAYDLGILKEDVEKFSHELRNFRNYIHPYSQVKSKFNPNKRTAIICVQVLKAAIYQIIENKI
jgi:hypothetical protein